MGSFRTHRPLAVDLDGTLTYTDTLHEALLHLLRSAPWVIARVPLWLLKGKAHLKAKIADRVTLNPETLPYNHALLDWLRTQRAAGRTLVLCTASDQTVAERIAAHLGLFDAVMGSDGQSNQAGAQKRACLQARFGDKGYDYAGNAHADVEVWKGAAEAIVVNAPASVLDQARSVAHVSHVIAPRAVSPLLWAQAFRVHQWLKNLLLFVPWVAAHRMDAGSLLTLAWAFMSFSVCASAVYVLNDLLDLQNDRLHLRKRFRPFASGQLSVLSGLSAIPILLALGLWSAAMVNPGFFVLLTGYCVLTTFYSLALKQHAPIDCLTLAGLYTLRIMAGAAAVSVPLSFWLLAFSTFIFTSLAFVKRYAELKVQESLGEQKVHGRGYAVSDAPFVHTVGTTTGYVSVLVLALYLNSDAVTRLYKTPEIIWLAVPLMLYWVSWVWLTAHRGKMHDDPIVFALKDRSSQVIGLLMALTFLAASQIGGMR